MRVFIQVKSAGKRRPALEKREYELPDGILTLKALIHAVVDAEVTAYNAKGFDAVVTRFLTETEIEDGARQGKVGFGRIYSDKKANLEKAREVALQAFEDGLFRVFVNDRECSDLNETADVSEGDTLTFVRFTFLSGRLW
jgi:hypothetical protein